MRSGFAVLFLLLLTHCGSSSSGSGHLTFGTDAPVSWVDHGAVGTPFVVTALVGDLLGGGDCGLAPCPPDLHQGKALSGSCDDDACEVVALADPPSAFRVTPTKAGTTVFHARVSDTDGSVVEDTLPFTFVDAATASIYISSPDADLDRLTYASAPGAVFTLDAWPSPGASDPHEIGYTGTIEWTTDSDAISISNGDYVDGHSAMVTAAHPGVATMTVRAGTISLGVTVTVIDPAKASTVTFRAIGDQKAPAARVGLTQSLGDDLTVITASLREADIPTTYAVVLHMPDGTLGLGGAELFSVAPSTLARLTAGRSFGSHPNTGEALAVVPVVAGQGNLTAKIGTTTVAIPLSVTP